MKASLANFLMRECLFFDFMKFTDLFIFYLVICVFTIFLCDKMYVRKLFLDL